MECRRYSKAGGFLLAIATLLILAGCGGGDLLADGGIIGTGTITGTVPGTIIEAYGENGEYLRTFSENNETDEHPFVLQVPAGVGFYLVMIINEDTVDEIIMPIAFQGSQGELLARIFLRTGDEIDLGHIPLFTNCAEIPFDSDPDADCILDKPFILDENQGSHNPLRQMDADGDFIADYDDNDHGYGHLSQNNYRDPQDHDNDRIPNYYDNDFSPGPNDADKDGIIDWNDKNPHNEPGYPHLAWNGENMHILGRVWLEEHGEHAVGSYEKCAACHGGDRLTMGPDEAGCQGCHAEHDIFYD